MQANIFTIGRLAEAAGVTPRTIRYYTVEGLLPPPDTRGRYARYSEAHLQRLQLIGRWKQDYLPLHVIQERLAALTEAQITALVRAHREAGVTEDARIPVGTDSMASPEVHPSEYVVESEDVVEKVHENTREAEAEDFLLQLLSEAEGVGRQETLPAILPRRRRVLLISPLVANSSEASEREEGGGRDATFILENSLSETWKRVALAPGVELHVRLPQSPEAYAHLDRMIAETRAIFKSLQ